MDPTGELTAADLPPAWSPVLGLRDSSHERQLLGAMGRIPDNSYQIGDQTKVLQWLWWDTSYGSPSCSPRRGRGGYSSTLSDGCRVEWTVSKGTSQWYHWEGYGCRSDTVIFPVH